MLTFANIRIAFVSSSISFHLLRGRGVWRLATNIPTSHPTNKIKRSVIWSDNLLRKMQDYTEQDGVGVLRKQIWRRKNKQADVPNHDIAVKHKIPGTGCTSYLHWPRYSDRNWKWPQIHALQYLHSDFFIVEHYCCNKKIVIIFHIWSR